ncbi:DUF1298 domain-containing protein [Nocardia sp. ET3-3]|uniref:diacylglycerol O-acyltransferase n=1 Tax=Nocardia terrae TaxID=2675851 RepID=A0A7K1V2M8_9NOCA|nr:wax ester/triacylglycerol synthase domain-containing protein [Nocardia terrae]MVU80752.1 DUF1298 domain-containing protein [Nocardia terrae]
MSKKDDRVEDLGQLKSWGTNTELNALEALMWRTEHPPAYSWSGIVLAVLESTPDWDRFIGLHEWGTRLVPRFTERVVEPLVPAGPPMWSRDPEFDLSNHLRRVILPAPASMEQLLEYAQSQGVIPLDRNRPPWIATLIEGLPGGRSAYMLQAHHVLMDGGSATQLFSRILGRHHRPKSMPNLPAIQKRPRFSKIDATLRGLGGLARTVPSAVVRGGEIITYTAQHPDRVRAYLESTMRVAQPDLVPPPKRLEPGPRTKWRFGMLECGLAELKKAGYKAEGTVNDAFVAAMLGGLRFYLESHGDLPEDLPMTLPVSVRKPDEALGGNRFTGAFLSAPSSVTDPVERIKEIHRRVGAARNEPALDFLNVLTPALNFAPSAAVSSALQSLTSNAVLMASSWAGPVEPVYVAGSRIQGMYVFAPLPSTSMCAAMSSQMGTCYIGLNADGDVFPDIENLWECMQKGLDEVVELAD